MRPRPLAHMSLAGIPTIVIMGGIAFVSKVILTWSRRRAWTRARSIARGVLDISYHKILVDVAITLASSILI